MPAKLVRKNPALAKAVAGRGADRLRLRRRRRVARAARRTGFGACLAPVDDRSADRRACVG